MADSLNLDSADFKTKVLESPVPVLVDFWAPWCGPCKAIGPTVEQVAADFAGRAGVYKLNVDDNGDIAQEYGVMSIPALLLFKDGKVVNKLVGAAPKPAIEGLIQSAL